MDPLNLWIGSPEALKQFKDWSERQLVACSLCGKSMRDPSLGCVCQAGKSADEIIRNALKAIQKNSAALAAMDDAIESAKQQHGHRGRPVVFDPGDTVMLDCETGRTVISRADNQPPSPQDIAAANAATCGCQRAGLAMHQSGCTWWGKPIYGYTAVGYNEHMQPKHETVAPAGTVYHKSYEEWPDGSHELPSERYRSTEAFNAAFDAYKAERRAEKRTKNGMTQMSVRPMTADECRAHDSREAIARAFALGHADDYADRLTPARRHGQM